MELYVAYYAPDQPDVKLVRQKSLMAHKEDEVSVTVEGRQFQVHETFIRSPLHSLVVWNWYWVDGKYTGIEWLAKMVFVNARLLRDRRGPANFAIATPDQPDFPRWKY